MVLESPRLDDRQYKDLLAELISRIPHYTPEWTDHNPSDPGITLLELFAWLTDIVLYRLNRVPDKHFIKFMELVGMQIRGAEVARAPVTFWLTTTPKNDLTIPMGTTVSTTRTETEEAISFTTDYDATIYVPTLSHVMTSRENSRDGRTFTARNMQRIQATSEGFPVFGGEGDRPDPGDALYLGFEQDLSRHLLALNITIASIAEGAGIDPTNPPYRWEVLSPDDDSGWVPVELDFDSTQGFNVSGTTRMFLPRMRRETRNEQRAYWLRCRMLPTAEDRPSYKISPRMRKVSVETWGITVNTSNVTSIQNEVVGRSDGSPGQRFYLAHTPVAPRIPGERLLVRVDDDKYEERYNEVKYEQWEEVTDFANSTPDDRHYTLDAMTGEIRLPPAMPQPDGSIKQYGAIVPKNRVLLMSAYRSGGGQVGNVAARALNVLKTSMPYIDRVSNRKPAIGGLDAEHLEDCKLRVPGHMRSLGRAVTPKDYEELALEAAAGAVSRAYCMPPNDSAPGQVKLLVVPRIPGFRGRIARESLLLAPEIKTRLQDYLDERRLLGTSLEIDTPSYVWVQTEVRLRPNHHFEAEQVADNVMIALFRYLNPIDGGGHGGGWQFGRDLHVSELIGVLMDVPGVDFIRSVKLTPVSIEDDLIDQEPVDVLPLPPDGVIASYEHFVILE